MDLREKKTRRSITNAFLQLRKKKEPERITVKELAELAEISKATFYLHYHDIYDLSAQLQNEVIQSILSSIAHPEYVLTERRKFTEELFHAFYAQQNLTSILFSGSQAAVLPLQIEKELRAYIHRLHPDITPRNDMLLTYTIQGGYYVYQKYCKERGLTEIIELVGSASEALYRTD